MSSREPHTNKVMEVSLAGPRKGYIARIVGKDEKYGVAREFLPAIDTNQTGTPKFRYKKYRVTEDGLYEMSSGQSRRYFRVTGDSREWLSDREWEDEKEAL